MPPQGGTSSQQYLSSPFSALIEKGLRDETLIVPQPAPGERAPTR
ncbi:hypothetical protein UYSO10_5708 [Kosakonia radicincitans]|nr:hypothetical protein UYSO10_5708 [Kosakonia radicincitans]